MMKKTYITWLLVMAAGTYMSGQIGIGTDIPKATLDVSGKSTDPKVLDGLIPPRIKGNDLKAKDNLYGNEQLGTIVYVTEIPNPTSAKTINIKSSGFYYFGGAGVWVAFKEAGQPSTDAARFLGGTVYVKFDNSSGGTLPNNRVIQNNSGTYSVGSLTGQSSRVGGVMTMNGNGYKISNPAQGIFDIQFDIPYQDIYGVALNTLDAYGNGSGGVSGGANPDSTWPGSRLNTKDNTQVAYLSNSIIRIKTGNSIGDLSNRTFTFVITGK